MIIAERKLLFMQQKRQLASLSSPLAQWGLLVIIWLFIVHAHTALVWPRLATGYLGDNDSAMRLAQIKDWLSGQEGK